MPLFGPPNVKKMREKKDVKGLIKALGYEKDRVVPRHAAEALRHIGDPRAVEPLIAAMKDGDLDVRKAAAGALGQIGDRDAVKPLIAAMKDRDANVRKAAARALGQIGDRDAVKPLLDVLRDESHVVRPAAAEALSRLRWEPDEGEDGAWYWVVKCEWEKASTLGSAAIGALVMALQDTKPDVRSHAAWALGKTRHTRAIEPLIAALKDNRFDMHTAAGNALILMGETAVEPLVAVLRDVDWHVRGRTAELLGQIGDPRAVEPLITALKDGVAHVRSAAAMALGEIGDPRAVEPLIAALKHADNHMRWAAAKVLGEIGDPRAVEPLIAAMKDAHENVCEAAAGALVRIGHAAVEPLVSALKDQDSHVRGEAARTLKSLKWKPDTDENCAWYWVSVREWEKASALGSVAVDPLIAALSNEDPTVRKHAAGVLVRIYRSKQIDVKSREAILSVRGEIASPHRDLPAVCAFEHEDTGTGLDFPL